MQLSYLTFSWQFSSSLLCSTSSHSFSMSLRAGPPCRVVFLPRIWMGSSTTGLCTARRASNFLNILYNSRRQTLWHRCPLLGREVGFTPRCQVSTLLIFIDYISNINITSFSQVLRVHCPCSDINRKLNWPQYYICPWVANALGKGEADVYANEAQVKGKARQGGSNGNKCK